MGMEVTDLVVDVHMEVIKGVHVYFMLTPEHD
jgi:hypothetical protein